MQKFISSLFIGVLLFHIGRTDLNDLSFDPLGQEKNRSIYLAKTGADRFVVSCAYTGDDADGMHAIQWINENGKVIKPSASILIYPKKNEKKLVFVNIKKHDTGEYKCRVQLKSGDFAEKLIFIKVISNVEWNSRGNIVGGNLGEPLTIDCGAKGDPEPIIEIADANGQSVEEAGFKVIDNQVTIENLREKHKNLVFKCLAIQKVNFANEFNATTTDEHVLTVDVYSAPEFDMPEVETYTITGKNVSLNCMVMFSNPRVERFNFYKGNQIIFNHERYEVSANITNQMATLRIDSVEEEDFGRYKCVAYNGKLSGNQIFVLKKTAPPKQPTVEILDVFNNSVVLRITENRDSEDDLPVLSYSVTYVPKLMHRAVRNEILEEELTKPVERHSTNFYRNTQNAYEIKGLEPNVQYEILVSPLNEVGEGDPVLINVLTGSRDNKFVLSSASRLFYGFNLMVLLTLAISVFLCGRWAL